ncbi:MAG: 50S ribosomal protein L31e [Candidatus Aenigmatarchaeota archaeon]
MTDEKVYNIPLRRVFSKTSRRRKSPAAVKSIRTFVSKMLRADDVVISPEINEFVWSRGVSHPPAKIRIKVRKEGDRVFADLVDTSKYAEKKAARTKVEKAAAKVEAPKETAAKKTEAKPEAQKNIAEKKAVAESKA